MTCVMAVLVLGHSSEMPETCIPNPLCFIQGLGLKLAISVVRSVAASLACRVLEMALSFSCPILLILYSLNWRGQERF